MHQPVDIEQYGQYFITMLHFIKQLYIDTYKVIISPKEYFSTMPETAPRWDPMVRALIYGYISELFFHLQLAKPAAKFSAFTLIDPFIQLFVAALIIKAITSLTRPRPSYFMCVRCCVALMPFALVSALLGYVVSLYHVDLKIQISLQNLIGIYSMAISFFAFTCFLNKSTKFSYIIIFIGLILNVLALYWTWMGNLLDLYQSQMNLAG